MKALSNTSNHFPNEHEGLTVRGTKHEIHLNASSRFNKYESCREFLHAGNIPQVQIVSGLLPYIKSKMF